jgi:hypothetical protein
MEFTKSAAKHGISEADALHAIRNVQVYRLQIDGSDSRMLIIGPDRQGRLLEIVVVPAQEPERIIHADVLRPKFYALLERG